MPKRNTVVMTGKPVTYEIPSPAGGVQLETFIPWKLVKRGVRRQVITPIDAPQEFLVEAEDERRERKAAQETPLIRALGLAHYWKQLLQQGKFRSLTEIAAAEQMDLGQASKIARLVYLDPKIVQACLDGRYDGLSLDQINRKPIPTLWSEQRHWLGKAPAV